MKKSVCSIAVAVLMLSGCSSIIYDSKQDVTIKTNPAGARVVVDGRSFTSPATVRLKGKSDYYVTAEKDGYRTGQGKIDSDFRIIPTVLGNILNLTGILGAGVDVLGTGAAFKLDREVNIDLEKK